LEFSYNPIGPAGAKVLAETLKFHGNVQTLRLGWCQIGVKGAEIFAECLQYNATITTLDLRANSLGDDVCYHSWYKISIPGVSVPNVA
jgi:Ran GTPase-activating protein (RanGAP) involved in mRNA processing and transport